MNIPKETLDDIRAELPRGSQVEIAKKVGYSDQYVSDFLNGKVNINKDNISILKECQRCIRNVRHENEKVKATIASISKSINPA